MRFLELQKEVIEIQFKLEFLSVSSCTDQSGAAQKMEKLQKELEDKEFRLQLIRNDLSAADVTVAVPNQDAISEISKKLAAYKMQDIIAAMASKKGEIYELLIKRGELLKRNYENRENTAKLSIILAKMDKETRELILAAVRSGCMQNPILLKQTDEFHRKRLDIFLQRLGICAHNDNNCTDVSANSNDSDSEVRVELSNRNVWVQKSLCDRLQQLNEKINDTNSKLQFKNAERQIRNFNEEEEVAFVSTQKNYLDFLKERDELLKDFYDEDKIEIVIARGQPEGERPL